MLEAYNLYMKSLCIFRPMEYAAQPGELAFIILSIIDSI